MDKFEKKALERLKTQDNIEVVRQVMLNAKDRSKIVYKEAFRRLVELSSVDSSSEVSSACWRMVHTIEELRRESGRKVWRMNRLRPYIEEHGERAALEYCASNRTDGFQEVLDFGLPEFTAEAIVLGYPEEFSDPLLVEKAQNRLEEAGIDPSQFMANSSI